MMIEQQELDKVDPSNTVNRVETNFNVAVKVLLPGKAKYEMLSPFDSLGDAKDCENCETDLQNTRIEI